MRCIIMLLVLLPSLCRATTCPPGIAEETLFDGVLALVDEMHVPLVAQQGALAELRGLEATKRRFEERLGLLQRGLALPPEVARPVPPPEPPALIVPAEEPPRQLIVPEPPHLILPPESPGHVIPSVDDLRIVVPPRAPLAISEGARVGDGVLVDEANLEAEVARYRATHFRVSEETAWMAVLTDRIERLRRQIVESRTDFDADRERRLGQARDLRTRLAERLDAEYGVAVAGLSAALAEPGRRARLLDVAHFLRSGGALRPAGDGETADPIWLENRERLLGERFGRRFWPLLAWQDRVTVADDIAERIARDIEAAARIP